MRWWPRRRWRWWRRRWQWQRHHLQVARHLRRALLPLVRHVGLVVVLLLDALRQVDRERAVGAAAPVLAAKLVERALLAVEREVGERVRLVLQLGVVLLGALLAARDDRVDVLLLELAALRVEDGVSTESDHAEHLLLRQRLRLLDEAGGGGEASERRGRVRAEECGELWAAPWGGRRACSTRRPCWITAASRYL